jgi:hypothetical protein
MKRIGLIALFAVLNLGWISAYAQVDTLVPNEVFVLDSTDNTVNTLQKTSDRGKSTGLVLRIGTGYRHGINRNRFSFEAASIPIEVELGVKYEAVEIGIRSSPYGLPLGGDDRSFGFFFPSGAEVTKERGLLSSIGFTGGYARLNLKINDWPFFVGYGRNFVNYPSYLRTTVKSDTADTKVIYTPNPSAPINGQALKYHSNRWTFGTEFGKFWWSVAMEDLIARGSNISSKWRLLSVQGGIQLPLLGDPLANRTPKKGARNRRFMTVIGLNAYQMPWARSALHATWFAEIGFRVQEQYRISLRGTFPDGNTYGTDNYLLRYRKFDNVPFRLPQFRRGYFDQDAVVLFQLNVDRVINPTDAFQKNIRMGLGYYRLSRPYKHYNTDPITVIQPWEEARHYPGVLAGYGFDYRLMSVRGVLHVPFAKFPPFLELSTGIRLAL